MTDTAKLKEMLCEIGKRVYNNGFVAANDGNFSVRLGENEILCTPTGISKGFMTPEMICTVDAEGKLLQAEGAFRPSSEIKMHLRVYKRRPDVSAVVHTHSPYATSFAVCGKPINAPIMTEAVVSLGCVPIAEYATPSTNEVPDSVEPFLEHFDAVLIANHGVLTWGADILDAYHKTETVEFYAKLTTITAQLGGASRLTEEQVKRLYELRRSLNLPGKHPAHTSGDKRCPDGCPGVLRCFPEK